MALTDEERRALLESINDALLQELHKKITSGEASAGHLDLARKVLKDNGITSTPVAGGMLGNLQHLSLPVFSDNNFGLLEGD